MTDKIIPNFNPDNPTFICSTDGSVLLMNDMALAVCCKYPQCASLCNIISQYDKFRFEFAMQSKRPQPIIAAATLVFEYSHICFLIENNGSINIAIAVMTKSENEAKAVSALSVFPHFFSSIKNFNDSVTDDYYTFCKRASNPSLLNVNDTIRRLINDTDPLNRAQLVQSEATDNTLFFSDMGLYSFTCFFIAAKSAISEFAPKQTFTVSTISSESAFELRFEVLTEMCGSGSVLSNNIFVTPKAEKLLQLCSFIANCSNYTFEVKSTSNNKLVLSLYTKQPDDTVDFKSCDPFKDYDHILNRALSSIEAICKEANQA